MKTIRIASENQGKLKEFTRILEPLGFCVKGMDDLKDLHIIEDGKTFKENAEKKARAVCVRTHAPAVADDTGLEVEALGNQPGVFSARFSGVEGYGRDQANRERLLLELEGVPTDKRKARFVSVLAYAVPNAPTIFFEGVLEGMITLSPKGETGFGYDPIFLVPEMGLTLAQMSMDQKNKVSHRGQAVRRFVQYLQPMNKIVAAAKEKP